MAICQTPATMSSSPLGRIRSPRLLAAWRRLFACALASLSLAFFSLALSGCANRDKGFDDEFVVPAKQLRRNKNGGQQMGLSARSRQIESDLGVE
jgi:hypothetical protein